ncbi:glutathione-disulfide reductase [Pedomonas mirosovicensis]|uniref:glutathione-disulfide reductase n=1 Tax=Pedomonas mirosovicensis TaxID=2908641 RepID=UPI002167EEB5|nr:glutathione-disulfide reductase [Pedomonas mirosovicensis]MCH8684346.1 glutathione-disulfide reductase [Pedomonas mirosovicensis]
MSQFDYDLFVIGAGSGGVRAARIASAHGAKVAIAEEYRVGGTCVIRGCVPKKLFVYASHYAEELEDAASFGWTVEGARFDWPTLRDNVQREVSRLQGLYGQTLAKAGVSVYDARATFLDPHTLDVGGQRVTARKILVATGATPVIPDFPGADLGFTSNEAFHLERLPKRILIYGGGYIATEFAGIFHGLGVEVTQAFRGVTILRGWDEELRTRLQDIYVQKGIHMRGGASIARLDRDGDVIRATMTDGAVIETDAVMYAIGRRPNIDGLGLDKANVKTRENGAILVDANSQTSCAHIYAVGDVTDRIQLTPVAIKEGHAFSDTVFGGKHWTADHTRVPSAVFSQPPLASVGLDEDTAQKEGHEIRVFRSEFRPMKFTLAGRQERTLCKLVVDVKTDRVLGAHMLGPDAPEIIQAVAIAVKLGATKAQFDQTVAVHPTAAEEFVLMR